MKKSCSTCDHGFLNLDAKGARLPLDIKCEIDGSLHASGDKCPRFAHETDPQATIGDSSANG